MHCNQCLGRGVCCDYFGFSHYITVTDHIEPLLFPLSFPQGCVVGFGLGTQERPSLQRKVWVIMNIGWSSKNFGWNYLHLWRLSLSSTYSFCTTYFIIATDVKWVLKRPILFSHGVLTLCKKKSYLQKDRILHNNTHVCIVPVYSIVMTQAGLVKANKKNFK